jgi:hypothetical protein
MTLLKSSILFALAFVTQASANTFDNYQSLLKKLTLSTPRPVVGGIASGFGAGKGTAYASVSYSDYDLQTEVDGDDDGSIMFGMGFGDPANAIGSEVTVGITSVSTGLWGDGKFADEGNISAKIHKHVTPQFGGIASISLGASNITGWGATTENPTNYFAAYSEQLTFGQYGEYGLAYTLGYGSGVSDMETSGDLFFGIGVGYDNYSGSVSLTGDETTLSLTYFVPQFNGFAVSVSRADAFNAINSERTIITLGYSLKIGDE